MKHTTLRPLLGLLLCAFALAACSSPAPTPNPQPTKTAENAVDRAPEPVVEEIPDEPLAPKLYEITLSSKFKDQRTFNALTDLAAVVGGDDNRTWRLAEVILKADYNSNGFSSSWVVQGPKELIRRYAKLLTIRSKDPSGGMYSFQASEAKASTQAPDVSLDNVPKQILVADKYSASKGPTKGLALRSSFSTPELLAKTVNPVTLAVTDASNTVLMGKILFQVNVDPEQRIALWFVSGNAKDINTYHKSLLAKQRDGEGFADLETREFKVTTSGAVEAGTEQ